MHGVFVLRLCALLCLRVTKTQSHNYTNTQAHRHTHLARAQHERHARPALVVDDQLARGKRRRLAAARHGGVIEVAGLAVAGGVLAKNAVLGARVCVVLCVLCVCSA